MDQRVKREPIQRFNENSSLESFKLCVKQIYHIKKQITNIIRQNKNETNEKESENFKEMARQFLLDAEELFNSLQKQSLGSRKFFKFILIKSKITKNYRMLDTWFNIQLNVPNKVENIELKQFDKINNNNIIDGFEFKCFDNKASLKIEFEKRKKLKESSEYQAEIIDKAREKSLPYCSKNEDPKITIPPLNENPANNNKKRSPFTSIGSQNTKRSKSTSVLDSLKSTKDTRKNPSSTIVENYFAGIIEPQEETQAIDEFKFNKEQKAIIHEIASFTKKYGLKQQQVADMTGVSLTAINLFLNNKNTNNHTKSLIYKWYLRYLKNPEVYHQAFSLTPTNEPEVFIGKHVSVIEPDKVKQNEDCAVDKEDSLNNDLVTIVSELTCNELLSHSLKENDILNNSNDQTTNSFTSSTDKSVEQNSSCTKPNEKEKSLQKENKINNQSVIKQNDSTILINLEKKQPNQDPKEHSSLTAKKELRIRIVQINELFPLNPTLIDYWNNFTTLGIYDQDFDW